VRSFIKEEVIPRIEGECGFRGVWFYLDPASGKLFSLTLYKTKEDLQGAQSRQDIAVEERPIHRAAEKEGVLGNPHVLFEGSWIAMFSASIDEGSMAAIGKAVSSCICARRTVRSRI